jgi:hypothetical protein
MDWTPLSRADLDEMIASGLQAMDDAVQVAWRSMRIEPEKWQCSPWGDKGGGFWVVAETDGHVVWYNDIEDGFNVSRFTTRGIIAEYACNQTSFEQFLLGLPVALGAENWLGDPSSAEVPSALQAGGTIVHRQTTYWDLRSSLGSSWRLRFKSKGETRFVNSAFSRLEILDSHPMLRHYVEPWSQLYFTGTTIGPAKLKSVLSEVVATASDGWRSLEEYLNGSANLKKGYGLLMRAPRSLIASAATSLKEMGLTPSTIDSVGGMAPGRVAIMDRNVIVAQEFRFEPLDPG